MLKRILFIVKYWLCWILLFDLARLAFIFSNPGEVTVKNRSEVYASLWHGLLMDASMAAYLTLPILIGVLLSVFFLFFMKPLYYIIYTKIVLSLVLILLFADIGLFKAWGFRLDDTLIRYLSSPREVWASVSHLPILLIVIGFIIILLLLIYFSNKLLNSVVLPRIIYWKWVILFVLLVLGAAFIIPIRGGFQLAPLNQSSVYFSQVNFANVAAINAPWNFMHALTHHTDNKSNPFLVNDTPGEEQEIDSLFASSYQIQQVIDLRKHPHPNVVVIIWESLTAKVINLSVNNKEITPGMNQLIIEGVYFSNIYATGDRTDKGIVAVLSGYPAQPTTSIVKEPGKVAKLPALGKIFAGKSYKTSFYYGGELEFANIKAYLLQGGYHKFVSIDDFDKKDLNSKWGAHDGTVMKRIRNDLAKTVQPFFATWLTLSSHEPYEIPTNKILPGKDDVSQFLSSIHYTDSIVFSLIKNARQQPWWKNTLVVIVADHGHRLPVSTDKVDDFKIPLLFLGGAMDTVRTRIEKIGSQTGIATTMAHQLGWAENDFKWSRNLLDSNAKPWALFSFNNGFGFVQPGGTYVYDNIGKIVIQKSGNVDSEAIKKGQLLQQVFFQDYLDK